MFKKIWNKIKSAGKWIIEKIKAAGRKVKNFVTEHPEETKKAVKAVAVVAACVGACVWYANLPTDPNYTPPTREEKLMKDANNLIFKARYEDDPEKAQVYLRNAEILDRMSRKEKAQHAEEEIRKAWGVYERYKDVDAAPAKRVYYDDHAPINEYSDFTGNQINVLEFDKGFWASLEGDFGGDKNLTLGQLGDTGEILKQSINPMGYDLTDTNLIDNVFVVIAKDKLVKEGDNG